MLILYTPLISCVYIHIYKHLSNTGADLLRIVNLLRPKYPLPHFINLAVATGFETKISQALRS